MNKKPDFTIVSEIYKMGVLLHTTIENKGDHSCAWYTRGDCTIDGNKITALLVKLEYSHTENTLTLKWIKE